VVDVVVGGPTDPGGDDRPPRDRWIGRPLWVEKPWGNEEIFALVPGRYCGKVLRVRAGQALSLQYHRCKEETIAVQSGRILLDVGAHESNMDKLEMTPGDVVHLPPRTRHRVTALTDAVLLESSTTELDDVVRLDDRYGRAGNSDG
jgi:mannose-6-phosphate isomerase